MIPSALSETPLLLAALTGLVSVIAMLVAEKRSSQSGIWIWKTAAATSFVIGGLLLGALDSSYGIIIFVGLVCGWFGDVFLIPKGGPWFLFGLIAFLLGHLAYIVAFIYAGLAWLPTLVVGVVATAVAAVVLRWLMPHVPKNLSRPVIIYVGVATAMVACAAGAVGAGLSVMAAVGAVAFFLSDIGVARNRFVAPGFTNRLWGTPLYFTSQWLIASTVVG